MYIVNLQHLFCSLTNGRWILIVWKNFIIASSVFQKPKCFCPFIACFWLDLVFYYKLYFSLYFLLESDENIGEVVGVTSANRQCDYLLTFCFSWILSPDSFCLFWDMIFVHNGDNQIFIHCKDDLVDSSFIVSRD